MLSIAKRAGGFSLAAKSAWRDRRLTILMYHSVSLADEHLWNPLLYLSPERFQDSLEVIRRAGCTVLPLTEAVERLFRGDLPRRAVALTFDDGTVDFSRVVVPALREHGFPATVFVSTYYSAFQRPVFNPTCLYLLWRAGGHPIDAAGLAASDEPFLTGSEAERLESFRRMLRHSKSLDLTGAAKHDLLHELAARIAVPFEPILQRRMFHVMDFDELSRLPPDIADVQLHTHTHRVPYEREAFLKEVRDNRRGLSDALGAERTFNQFCYPAGEYDLAFLPWLAECDVDIAVTCDPSLASADHHRYLLPRVGVSMLLQELELEAWLTGFRELALRPLAR